MSVPHAVLEHPERGARGSIPETPKPGYAHFERVENRVIATAQASLQAAAKTFRVCGIGAAVLGDTVTGEARAVAGMHAALVRQILLHGEPWKPPVALLSGGECTVTIRTPALSGRRGPCSEFLLALALDLEALGCDPRRVHALAADTDGIDGSEDNAGAVCTVGTLDLARARNADPRKSLDSNDAYVRRGCAGAHRPDTHKCELD